MGALFNITGRANFKIFSSFVMVALALLLIGGCSKTLPSPITDPGESRITNQTPKKSKLGLFGGRHGPKLTAEEWQRQKENSPPVVSPLIKTEAVSKQPQSPETPMIQKTLVKDTVKEQFGAGTVIQTGTINHLNGSTEIYERTTFGSPSSRLQETIQEASTEVGGSRDLTEWAIAATKAKNKGGIGGGLFIIAVGIVLCFKRWFAPGGCLIIFGILGIAVTELGIWFVVGGIALSGGAYFVWKSGHHSESQAQRGYRIKFEELLKKTLDNKSSTAPSGHD